MFRSVISGNGNCRHRPINVDAIGPRLPRVGVHAGGASVLRRHLRALDMRDRGDARLHFGLPWRSHGADGKTQNRK